MDTETVATPNHRAGRRTATIARRGEDARTSVAELAERIVREPECYRRTGLSRSTRWRLERVDLFPR